jgi:hypothetical protein
MSSPSLSVCARTVEHSLDGYVSDAWTAAQVMRFSGCSLDGILERWRAAAGRLAHLPDDPVFSSPTRWALGDAIYDEADILGAVAADRVRHPAVLLGLQSSIGRWRQVLDHTRVANLRVLTLPTSASGGWECPTTPTPSWSPEV